MKKTILLTYLLICVMAVPDIGCYADIADDLRIVKEDTSPLGDAGRLYVPSLDLSVALYEIPEMAAAHSTLLMQSIQLLICAITGLKLWSQTTRIKVSMPLKTVRKRQWHT